MGGSFWGGMLLTLVIVQVLVIWSIRRHRDPSLKIECDAPIDRLMPSLAGLTLGTAVAGNRVQVHENGAFFDVLLARIAAAQHTVHFETFLWKEGELARRLADTLSERARAGLKVRVLLDAQGSRKAGDALVQQMKNAGCQVCFFHKKALRNIGVLNDRDHRKLAVIDGREAFVGGHCIVDDWLGTTGWATPKTTSTSPTSACSCTAPSCTACRAPSARTGPARPASFSSATTCSPRWSRPATR
jgi:cardiolipin synthase A/B